MRKGDIVIADYPKRRSCKVSRFYGVVVDVVEGGNVIIELSDGSVIKRQSNSIAVYVQPPPNWKHLFTQRNIVLSANKTFSAMRSAKKNRKSET